MVENDTKHQLMAEGIYLRDGQADDSFRRHFGSRANWRRYCGVGGAVLTSLAAFSLAPPVEGNAAGLDYQIDSSVDFEQQGVSLQTSAGGVEVNNLTALPIGLTVAPAINMNFVKNVAEDPSGYPDRLAAGAMDDVSGIVKHYGGYLGGGLIGGGLGGTLLFEGAASLLNRRDKEQANQTAGKGLAVWAGRSVLASTVAAASLAAVGTASFYHNNSDSFSSHQLADRFRPRSDNTTGMVHTLLEAKQRYASLQANTSLAAQSIEYAKSALQVYHGLGKAEAGKQMPSGSFNFMTTSDVHLRNNYPFVKKLAQENNVEFIINAGDESFVGNGFELTKDYVNSIRQITEGLGIPMFWVQGNHDTKQVANRMADIPGVIVLDNEVAQIDGLTIWGVGDPTGDMVLGGPRGTSARADINRQAADKLLTAAGPNMRADIFQTHEPKLMDMVMQGVNHRRMAIRLGIAGHTHRQNSHQDVNRPQRNWLRVVEGTTGDGGLVRHFLDGNNTKMEMSVMTVTPDCQFAEIERFKYQDPIFQSPDNESPYGDDHNIDYNYLMPQDIAPDRRCSPALGLTKVSKLSEYVLQLDQAGQIVATK